ncbi:MAG: nicotinate-nucleotide--dimethylbenzimidazole phosphoribosyltransferase [Nitrospirae bacterium]|nr:nicotinate-nucleotide--dimethylbenzimidazole phosphoribosyltransferase [Nitrospirota bacterium]
MTISEATAKIKPIDDKYIKLSQERLDSLTKPRGSLGKLEDFAKRLCAVYQTDMPEMPKKGVFVFAGDHGVVEEGVSAYPSEVTPQMVFNFLRGGAGINVLARHAGADVFVIDMGVNYVFKDCPGLINKKVVSGTKNMCKGPAMSTDDAVSTIEAGISLAEEYAKKGYRLFGTGDMGIGNTTPSSAITAVLTGLSPQAVTSRGTGIDDAALAKKIKAIETALTVNKPDRHNALDVLSKVGGAEIGGIAGLCIGAASLGIPVVVDGFISTAGAAIACVLDKRVSAYLIGSHMSQEGGHKPLLNFMGVEPLFDFNMRLGEGTGAALAMTVLDASLKIYREMATFAEAMVSDTDKDIHKT